MNAPFLPTVLLAGVAALDGAPIAQTMLSQPLIAGTILGLLWGDMQTALQVAIVLQVIAASTLPVGARTPEDYAVGGVVGVGLALALASRQPFIMARDACALVGVLGGLLAATGGVPLLKWQRRRNEARSRWCEEAIRGGDERALGKAHLAAIVLAFGVGVAWAGVCLAAGVVAFDDVIGRESLRLARAWSLAQPLWLGLGLAHVLNAFVQRRLARAAVFGAALIAAWLALIMGTP